jgi:hypothetical protein
MAHLLLANPMLRLNFDVIDYWARLDESAKDVAVSWMPTPQYAEAQRWGKGEMSMAWRYFMQKTGSWDAIRHVRHGSSIDPAVAQRYANNSIDFIYLDTAHDAALTRAELAIWWPKVKESGGWLCGDDYHGGMRKKRLRRESIDLFRYFNAVNAFFKARGKEVEYWGNAQFCVGKKVSAKAASIHEDF